MTKKEKKDSLLEAIIKTLCYFQVFSYPLTPSELYKYLHFHKKITFQDLIGTVEENPDVFERREGYIVLRGDYKLIETRSSRMQNSKNKFMRAFWIVQFLKFIPSVKLIGISGSLSMNNAKKHDDIDLFFITSENTLWVTRLLVNVTLLLLREKRSKKDSFASDKICPNMFMAENKLKISQKLQNIYMAHEVAQLRVLFNRNNTYNLFLLENSWVLRFIPNAFEVTSLSLTKKRFLKSVVQSLFSPVEKLFYSIQLLYMKKNITAEVVHLDLAMFHPNSHARVIQEIYKIKTHHQINYLKLLKKNKKKPVTTATH